MFPDSAWADEARRSSAIKPLSGGSTARRPKDAFEEKLLAGFYPDYGHLFFDATNTLLPMARSEAAQPSAAQFSHLLDGELGPRCAGAGCSARERADAGTWETEPRAAAE